MHLLATTSASLEDLAEPVDLDQAPAEMVALSFTDSDLAALAAAWQAEGAAAPGMRLAALRDLRHPMSVDLWIDKTARHARVILVRILGGYDWWRYGCDRLAAVARDYGIALALLPGESHERDERLTELSTVPEAELTALLACFREGGPANMRTLLRRMARLAGRDIQVGEAEPLPKVGFYDMETGKTSVELEKFPLSDENTPPVVPILFYRSMLLAADVAPVDALAEALARQGITAVPIFVSSLKDPAVVRFIENATTTLKPAAIVTATAFASGAEPGAETLFDRLGVPVFQAFAATTRGQAWQSGQRGLAPADLAMHVVLPELDGRIMAGAIGFKGERGSDDALGFRGFANNPEPDRVEQVAKRIAAMVRLQRTPPAERRIAILMPDYPGAAGRTGYAVGLDVPSSVLAMLRDLKDAGYAVEAIPESPRALLNLLERSDEGLDVEAYRALTASLSADAMAAVEAAWGALTAPPSVLPDISPSRGEIGSFDASTTPATAEIGEGQAAGAISPLEREMASRPEGGKKERQTLKSIIPFRAARFGNITVALAPDRGRSEDRRADYHDPKLPPRHELIAFGLWLREALGCHALVHVGAHGTLEWLPGKTVALSRDCFPEIVTGALPVVYPFIVSNPGEAAQAKRRIAAVTIGHLPHP